MPTYLVQVMRQSPPNKFMTEVLSDLTGLAGDINQSAAAKGWTVMATSRPRLQRGNFYVILSLWMKEVALGSFNPSVRLTSDQ